MCEQPTPLVTNDDVERLVKRDFVESEREEVWSLLAEYGGESWHREPARVRLATLKLANGSVRRLRAEIEVAKLDFRDVLALAEYPGYMKHHDGQLAQAEAQRIISADWKQYQEWLSQ